MCSGVASMEQFNLVSPEAVSDMNENPSSEKETCCEKTAAEEGASKCEASGTKGGSDGEQKPDAIALMMQSLNEVKVLKRRLSLRRMESLKKMELQSEETDCVSISWLRNSRPVHALQRSRSAGTLPSPSSIIDFVDFKSNAAKTVEATITPTQGFKGELPTFSHNETSVFPAEEPQASAETTKANRRTLTRCQSTPKMDSQPEKAVASVPVPPEDRSSDTSASVKKQLEALRQKKKNKRRALTRCQSTPMIGARPTEVGAPSPPPSEERSSGSITEVNATKKPQTPKQKRRGKRRALTRCQSTPMIGTKAGAGKRSTCSADDAASPTIAEEKKPQNLKGRKRGNRAVLARCQSTPMIETALADTGATPPAASVSAEKPVQTPKPKRKGSKRGMLTRCQSTPVIAANSPPSPKNKKTNKPRKRIINRSRTAPLKAAGKNHADSPCFNWEDWAEKNKGRKAQGAVAEATPASPKSASPGNGITRNRVALRRAKSSKAFAPEDEMSLLTRRKSKRALLKRRVSFSSVALRSTPEEFTKDFDGTSPKNTHTKDAFAPNEKETLQDPASSSDAKAVEVHSKVATEPHCCKKNKNKEEGKVVKEAASKIANPGNGITRNRVALRRAKSSKGFATPEAGTLTKRKSKRSLFRRHKSFSAVLSSTAKVHPVGSGEKANSKEAKSAPQCCNHMTGLKDVFDWKEWARKQQVNGSSEGLRKKTKRAVSERLLGSSARSKGGDTARRRGLGASKSCRRLAA